MCERFAHWLLSLHIIIITIYHLRKALDKNVKSLKRNVNVLI